MRDTILRRFPRIIAAFAFVIIIYQAGLARGFELRILKFGHSWFVESQEYFVMSFFMMIVMIVLSVKPRMILNVICAAALALTLYQFRYVYAIKLGISDEGEPISLWLRESIPLDVLGFLLVAILLFVQIANLTKAVFRRNKLVTL